jgi:hypothetical protein
MLARLLGHIAALELEQNVSCPVNPRKWGQRMSFQTYSHEHFLHYVTMESSIEKNGICFLELYLTPRALAYWYISGNMNHDGYSNV